MNIFTSCIRCDGEYRELIDTLRKNFRLKPLPVLASGLCEGAGESLLTAVLQDTEQERNNHPALILAPDEKDCVKLTNILSRNGIRAVFYPARDLTFFDMTSSHEYEQERIKILSGILSDSVQAVVTTPDASLSYTIPSQRLEDCILTVDAKTPLDLKDAVRRLLDAGFVRVDLTESPGQFSQRGDILDVYPPFATFETADGTAKNGSFPFRVELFGDDIDRMGIFDPDTQRLTEQISSIRFTPCREILCDRETLKELKKEVTSQWQKAEKKALSGAGELQKECETLERAVTYGETPRFLDKYISFVYPEKECLLSYFPEKSLCCVFSSQGVSDRLKAYRWRQNETVTGMLEGGLIASALCEYDAGDAYLTQWEDKNVTLHVNALAYRIADRRLSGLFGFRTRHTVSYRESENLLFEDLHGYVTGGYRCFVLTENEVEARLLSQKLTEAEFILSDVPDSMEKIQPGTVSVLWKEIIPGFEMPVPKIVFLSTYGDARVGGFTESAGKIRHKKRKTAQESILSYNDLQKGDYVVHETYGIGQYTGMETKTITGVTRDYIGIHYEGGDLFLPVEKLDMISKYIGAHGEDGTVKLNRLGTDNWKKATAKAKASAKDMAKELIDLYARRMRLPGFAFLPDDRDQKAFEDAFEYEETDSQLTATDEIKKDMMVAHPMDRLLCGDVGYGKTEVALRSAFKAVNSGKQVAILVPTTLLCLQHYQTILSRMRAFAVNVEMISRFRSPKEQKETLRRVERGETDILVGTHRILSEDIHFKDLGLVIIDEEQRFGVAQKEKLKQRTTGVDVLSLSATPIPRTLNMAMGGIRDISVLDEAPRDRLPIQTYVLEEDDLIIADAIRREMRRGGQVYYLCNNIEELPTLAGKLSRQLPDARIVTAHGQMGKDELEKIWGEMLTGEIDILVCTTIIETGVDVPNANTLIVANAHKLGLSQLHQIRGRIGRSARRAYAYFTYPRGRALSEISEKRLEAIRAYGEFGSGFRIAMRDMELRGAGDLLGSRQHGHLDAVGYDLFIKLLNRAVLEEKGETVREKTDCTVNLGVSAYLPEKYVPYPKQRMELYKKISLIQTEEDYREILDELCDRFGEPPKEAIRLLDIAKLKNKAQTLGMKSIREENGVIHIFVDSFNLEAWSSAENKHRGQIRLMAGDGHIRITLKKEESALPFLSDLLGGME